ncbi:MAG: DUF4386 domain-containing protein [Candidatus Schekmanbacteria bacterium]|nr:DUF4386 domain-containing protein [Candidatus Schekmanbacteria bacterium]
MTSGKRVGRIIGMLLLVQLATGLTVPYIVLLPLTTAPAGFLETAAGMSAQVRLGVLLLFVGGAVSVGVSVAAWPAVRERSYRLGLWLLALAVVNFTLQICENGHWLTMLSLGQAYAAAGAADHGPFQALGIAVRSAWKWAHYSHIFIVVAWLFTLYCVLLRCAMVPRALAAIGMTASVLHFTGITLPVLAGYSMPFPELFGMPMGLANLVLAVWLMAKGFKEGHATSG